MNGALLKLSEVGSTICNALQGSGNSICNGTGRARDVFFFLFIIILFVDITNPIEIRFGLLVSDRFGSGIAMIDVEAGGEAVNDN